MNETGYELAEVAAALSFAADRLATLAEGQTQDKVPEVGLGDAAPRRIEQEGQWMRGARKELARLIRGIEGPNPPPTTFPLLERVDAK